MSLLRKAAPLVFPLALAAQYPAGQYPGTTNPNTYPPNYPSTYPNNYPNTYPGPGGVGISLPGIHLPGRKQKGGEASQAKVNVASVDGTLRSLGEKELLLQVAAGHVLRFRLLAKTEFRDKDQKPMRDSLLHPGDRITVEANPDDPETALHVILAHSGSKAERTAASAPLETASISTPEAGDLGRPHQVAAPGSAASEPVSETSVDERPTLTRKPGAEDSAPSPQPSAPSQQQPASQLIDPVIADARTAAQNFTAELPNFVVQQVTTRYQGSRYVDNWHAIDIVTSDVASVDGKEEYKNIRINGHPAGGAPQDSGSWSTGEFSTTLEDILSPYTDAHFKYRGEDRIANRPSLVYDLTVDQSRSHWVLVSPDGKQYRPAYKGSLWIDKQTRRVLRIEQVATGVSHYVYDRAETVLDYGFVAIDGRQYLLPIQSENVGCMAGTAGCSRNVIEFRNYRKYGSDSNIVFDKFAKSF